MKIFIFIMICFILPLIVIVKPIMNLIKNKKNVKNFFSEYKEEIILVFILMIGSVVRLYGLGKFPNALNADEASSGYDAYSLMKYGIDRGGNSYPVYLYAWGNGQSILYSIITIPVILFTGLTEYGIRLPMTIVGCMSLYVFYYLLKNIFDNKKMALIGTAFFAICPWHIMKSRWGMECNLFPDLILLSVLLLSLGIKNKNNKLYVLGFIFLAISSYSYATSYLFLPVFVLGILGYLIYIKETDWKRVTIYLSIMFLICVPIIIYVIINTLDLNQIKIFGIAIPRMISNRYDEASTIFSGNLYENCVNNLLETVRILLLQIDGLEWNAIAGYGLFYGFSIIWLIYGIYISIKKYKKNVLNMVMHIWMISSIVLCAFCIPNINRINIIMIPCIYYIVIGLYEFFSRYKFVIPCIVALYIGILVCFIEEYINKDYNEYATFTSGVEEVSKYCENGEYENVYCLYSFKEPFIYFLFYSEYDTNNYVETVEFFREDGTFENVKSFGKYHFYLPEDIPDKSIVIVPKNASIDFKNIKNKVNINQFDLYEF